MPESKSPLPYRTEVLVFGARHSTVTLTFVEGGVAFVTTPGARLFARPRRGYLLCVKST
jgi:hypothetical protein